MIGMTNPRILLLLAFLPLLLLLALIHLRLRSRVLDYFKGEKGRILSRYWGSSLAFALALALGVIALGGPTWGEREVARRYYGVDLVLALDLSRSMDIEDAGKQSRLEAALSLAKQAALSLGEGGRIALVLGKGSAVLALPLTMDREAILGYLDSLGTWSVTGRGTNLEDLLTVSYKAFSDSFITRRQVLLLSDGESLSGESLGEGPLEGARRGDIRVSACGLGSDQGRAVPGLPGSISRRESKNLRDLARGSGGIYLDGNLPESRELLRQDLEGLIGLEGLSYRLESRDGRPLFLYGAALLLFLGMLMREKRRL